MSISKLTIGTRGSDLALWQARWAASLLSVETGIKIIKTTGDKFQGVSLQGGEDQGYFTKEIEDRLLAGEVDAAVHSLKDLPTAQAAGLTIGAVLRRAPVSDVILIHPEWRDDENTVPVREGCAVGAMSLRRQALLRLYAPHALPAPIRGNVPGRIERCIAGEFGAIILARAGVERLGLFPPDLAVYEFDPEVWLPAPGQGAIAVQAREGDEKTLELLAKIDDKSTRIAVELERRILSNFEGGCHTAFGAWAIGEAGKWKLRIGLEDGGMWKHSIYTGDKSALEKLGPASGIDFAIPKAVGREDLCKPLSPS